jgi:hypothetical protein
MPLRNRVTPSGEIVADPGAQSGTTVAVLVTYGYPITR